MKQSAKEFFPIIDDIQRFRRNKDEIIDPVDIAMQKGIRMAYADFNAFVNQLYEESIERKNLILYLKVLLPVFALAPLCAVIWMINKGLISGKIESLSAVITAILAVPIEIIGVFKVISDKLFADTYRTSLPEMMGKYKEFNGADKKDKQ